MAAPIPQCFPTGSVVWSNCPALNVGCYLYVDDEATTPIPAGTYADAFTCVTTDSNGYIVAMNDCPLFYQVIRIYDCNTSQFTLVNDYITFLDNPTFTPEFQKFYLDAYDGCLVYQVFSTFAYRTIPSNATYYEAFTTPAAFNGPALCNCGIIPQ
jgi:hypothetical protein